MMTLSINDRVSYQGEKATVKQVWKKKVKVILSDLREMTVGIDEISPGDEAIPGQLPLIDLSPYQLPDRPISQWDLENEDSIAIGPARDELEDEIAIEPLAPEKPENSIAIEPARDELEDEIDAIKIDVQSLPTYQLITLYEVIARELHYRDESEVSLPNSHPNSLPNCLPNSHPNSHPNSLPNSLPNSHPNCLPNSHPNSLPNSHPNSHPNSLPNSHPNSLPNCLPNSHPNSLPNCLPNCLPNSLPNPHPNYGYEEIKTIKGRMYRYWRWLENGKLRSKYLGRVASSVK